MRSLYTFSISMLFVGVIFAGTVQSVPGFTSGSVPVLVDAGHGISNENQFDISVADGTIYVGITDFANDQVGFAWSDDDGQTWNVATEATGAGFARAARVHAVDDDVVWVQSVLDIEKWDVTTGTPVEVDQRTEPVTGTPNLNMAFATDGAFTFAAWDSSSDNTDWVSHQSASLGAWTDVATGTVNALCQQNIGDFWGAAVLGSGAAITINNERIYRSGDQWGSDCTIDATFAPGGIIRGGSAFVEAAGSVWYAATTTVAAVPGVYYATSGDDGVTWSAMSLVGPSESDLHNPDHPDLVVIDGDVWIFWTDSNQNLVGASSGDGFTQQFTIVTGGVVSAADVFYEEGNNKLHVAYEDDPNGDLYYLAFDVEEVLAPKPPAGVAAVVTKSDAPGAVEIELTWILSSNDPDQDVGQYDYQIFIFGVDSGTDPVTAKDGEGTRFNLINFGSGEFENVPLFIKAFDPVNGLVSGASCTVTVFSGTLGDSDSCGGGAPGSGLIFTTPTDTAAGLSGFCTDLMGDSEASKFLCGLILVVIVFLGIGAAFAAMAGAPGMPAVIAGSVGAFGLMIFLVVAQIWSLGAAAVIILLATGVALALMRRLFFGGGTGGG